MNHHSKSIVATIISTLIFFLSSSFLKGQDQQGTIKILEAEGEVILTDASGTPISPTEGDEFTEGYTITTGQNSSVILFFSNGSSITIDENTSLVIQTFRQTPFESEDQYEQLGADPSTSSIVIYLQQGTIVSRTKRLQPDSSYQVLTPDMNANLTDATAQISYQKKSDESKTEIINLNGDVQVGTDQSPPIQVDEGSLLTITGSPDGGKKLSIIQPVTEGDVTPLFTPDIERTIVDLSPSEI